MKLSDYVIDFIIKQGVKHVFMLPGGAAMHLNDSLGKRRKEIEFVGMLHEQAVSIAAEAYVKVTNLLGTAMVTGGPGGTNAITGVAGAWLDSMPCLFLSGQVKRPDLKASSGLRQLGSQEVDIVSIVKPITKYAVTITNPNTVRFHLEKALFRAKSGRPGPVWLDFPIDVQAVSIDTKSLKTYKPKHVSFCGEKKLVKDVKKLIKIIKKAKRPVIIAGNGIRVAGGVKNFLNLVDLLQIPVLTTWLGMDLIHEDHPYFAGRPGSIAPRSANFTLQNSDLMIVIGSRLDMAFTGYAHNNLAREAKKVMVDIDKAEISKMRTKIDLPIVADANLFLLELLRQWKSKRDRKNDLWADRVYEWKRKYPVVQKIHRKRNNLVSVYYFSDILSQELQEGDLIVSGSSGTAVELFLLAFKVKKNQRIFHTRGLGAMGFGLPASIGACLAAGRRKTICVDGDGGFQMNIQELATLASLKLPVKIFVINNGGYASIRSSQQNYFDHLVAADESSGLHLPDLMKITTAYDLPFVRIHNQKNMRLKIREILESSSPQICEIMSPWDEPRAPRLTSVQHRDGSIRSKPLEDLWPFLNRTEFLSNMIIKPIKD